MIRKMPSALDWADWADLIDKIPEERVDFDENDCDPEKSPEFHDWMVNG